ncbi:MAG TPA: exo-alpha-sialidase [Bauldia sp.]|nr:exo-alpha-sialidase [Bauldia sp.]
MTRLNLGLSIAALTAILYAGSTEAAESVAELGSHTHIHGLAVDRQKAGHLLIATHHGLYHAAPDGSAELVSIVQDFMGFNPDPEEPASLFASGHPAGGGNLGVIHSSDNGRTWTELSPGAGGPVDFHQMTVSPVDPDVIFGAYGSLQVSRDGGKTWTEAAPAPERLIDLAASAKNADTLYAATEGGLLVSPDAGLTWRALIDDAPVTMVETGADGALYAFVYGEGLKMAREGVFKFETLAGDWGDGYILHLAVDPTDAKRLYAATGEGEVLASADGGATWSPFGE